MLSNVSVKLVSDISGAVFIIRGVVSARFIHGVLEVNGSAVLARKRPHGSLSEEAVEIRLHSNDFKRDTGFPVCRTYYPDANLIESRNS
jgi:hypothetical protein